MRNLILKNGNVAGVDDFSLSIDLMDSIERHTGESINENDLDGRVKIVGTYNSTFEYKFSLLWNGIEVAKFTPSCYSCNGYKFKYVGNDS
jgi:hypothetical protein